MRNNLIHETNPSAPFNQFLPRRYREGTGSLQRGSSLPHFEQRRSKSIENVHSEANQVAASMRDVHLEKLVEDRWQQDLDKWKEKRCGANADLLQRKSQRENLIREQGAGLYNGHSRNFLGTQLENGGSSRKPEFGKARAYGSLDRHSRLADYSPSTESYRTLLNRQTPSSAYHNVTTVDAPVASRRSNSNESSQARVQMVRQSPAWSNSSTKPLDKPPVPRNEPIAEDSDEALYRGYLKGGRSSTESRIDVEPSSKVHVPRVLTPSQAFEGIARVDPIDDSESTAKTVRSSVMLTLSQQQHTEPKVVHNTRVQNSLQSIGEQESKTAHNFSLKTQQSAWLTKSTPKVIPNEVTSHDEVDFPRRQPSQATSWQQRWEKDQERRRKQEEQCSNEDEERKQKQEEWERSVKEQHQKEEQILADAEERRNVAQMQRQKDEDLKRERLQKLERRYEVERLQSLEEDVEEEDVEEEGDMKMRGKEEEEKKLDDSDQRNCSKDFDSSTSPKEGRLDGAKDVVKATAEFTSPNPYLLHHSPTDSTSRVRRTSWRSQTIEQDPLRSPALLPPCTSLNGNDQGQASPVNRHTWRSPNLTPPYTLLCANDQGRARLVNQQSLKSPTLNPPYTSLFGNDKGRASPVNRYTLKSPTLIPPYISLYGNGQGRASPVNEITLRSQTLSRSYTSLYGNDQGRASPVNRHTLRSPTLIPPYISLYGNDQGRASPVNEITLRSQTLSRSCTSLHGNDQGRASPVNRHTLKSPTLIPPYISLRGNGQGRASPVNEISLRSQTLSPSYTSPDWNGHIRASPLNQNTMSTALSMPDISLSSNIPEQTSTMNLHSWHENTNAAHPSNGKGSIFSRTNQGSLTSHTKPPKKLNTKAKNCKSCWKSIARGMAMHISSLNIYFHMDCFKCSRCDQSLSPKQGGLDVLIMSEKLFCHTCYAIVKDVESRAQKM